MIEMIEMDKEQIESDLQLYITSIENKIVEPDGYLFTELGLLEEQMKVYQTERHPLAEKLEHLMLYTIFTMSDEKYGL